MAPSYVQTPNRRMTLGPLPNNAGTTSVSTSSTAGKPPNPRRLSMVAGGLGDTSERGAPPSARPPKATRQSMIPRIEGGGSVVVPSTPRGAGTPTGSTASSRRRSVGGGGGPPGSIQQRRQSMLPPAPASVVKADPRNTGDKTFQTACVKKLHNYLNDNGYNYPITYKGLLRGPSTKDFGHMVTFLLRKVDPTFQQGSDLKLEDEVSMFFKILGYPFTVSKTALVAAGSSHTWPTLLSALTWLIDHVTPDETGEDDDAVDMFAVCENYEQLNAKTDQSFYKFLSDAYSKSYLHMDDGLMQKFQDDLFQMVDRDDQMLVADTEHIIDINATILERIEQLKSASADLPTYAKKKEDYLTDLEQFKDLIKQMEGQKAALELSVAARDAELRQINAELERTNADVEDLKNTLRSQIYSVDDVRKMEAECKSLRDTLERAQEMASTRKAALKQAEKDLQRVVKKLDTAVTKYNDELAMAGTVPDLDDQRVASLDKTQLSGGPAEILGFDVGSDVQPKLINLITEYTSKLDEIKSTYQDALDRATTVEKARGNALVKLQVIEEKQAKYNDTLQQEQNTHDAKMAVRQREIDALESKIHALRDPVAIEEQMASYERQCAELEALKAKHAEENVAKTQAMQVEIAAGLQLMAEHDAYWQHKLGELETYWQAKASSTTTQLSVPANFDV